MFYPCSGIYSPVPWFCLSYSHIFRFSHRSSPPPPLPLFLTLSPRSSISPCYHPCLLVSPAFLVFTVLSLVCFFAHFTSSNFTIPPFYPVHTILPAPIVCLFFERKKNKILICLNYKPEPSLLRPEFFSWLQSTAYISCCNKFKRNKDNECNLPLD